MQAGLFVTSPPTAPSERALVPGTDGEATGATATFDQISLAGSSPGAGWTGQDVGANASHAVLPTLGSASYRRAGSGYSVTGSGDIGPSVGAGDTDRNALTGVFIGLIVLIVLGAMFITGEYRRGLIRTTLAASPRRGQVLLAKALVIGAVAFVVGAGAAAISIPLGNHILRTNGNYVYPIGTLTLLRVILGTGALVALASVLSLALGTALRHGAGSDYGGDRVDRAAVHARVRLGRARGRVAMADADHARRRICRPADPAAVPPSLLSLRALRRLLPAGAGSGPGRARARTRSSPC